MNNIGAPQAQQSVQSWRDECAAKEIDDWQVGWIKDRAHFCTHAKLSLSVPNDEGQVGTVLFDWLVYGIGSVGAGSERTLTINSELRDLHGSGWPSNKLISVNVGCTVQVPVPDPAPPRSCLGSMSVSKTAQGWQADPTATNYLYSEDDWTSKNNDNERVVMIAFKPTVSTATDSRAGAKAQADAAVSFNAYARFDSAKYLTRGSTSTKGAIFRGVVPHLSYDPSKPEVKEVAEHIRDACDPAKVNATFPPTGGPPKHIPGCSIDDLIHRVAPTKDGEPVAGKHKKRYQRNDSVKTSNCRICTSATPSEGVKQCDEFPFRSTYEGTAASKFPPTEFAGTFGLGKLNQFSIRKVDADQNSKAGQKLGAWYLQDRILDWSANGTTTTSADGKMRDGFWVRIGPT